MNHQVSAVESDFNNICNTLVALWQLCLRNCGACNKRIIIN